MPLTNEQYETIMREYNRRQADARLKLNARKAYLEERIPALKQIEDDIASMQVARAKYQMMGSYTQADDLKEELYVLQQEKLHLLKQAGFSESDLKISYTCEDCQDTGFIHNQKCHCFKQAEIDLLYLQSHLKEILKKENFSFFREEYYSDDLFDSDTQQSSKEAARTAYRQAKAFIKNFDETAPNLFFYGNTGIGKTFLSHCIAKELLDRSRSVIYFSSYQLFDLFAKQTFSHTEAPSDFTDHVFNCDLLIIDDLGTELVNSFVSSQLFTLVNERLVRKKSTIISTNLTISQFMNTYSERIFSRISSNYSLVKLFGDDIRLKKKFMTQST